MAGANGKYKEVSHIILNVIANGGTNRDGIREAGINEDTFYTWIKERPEFSEAVKAAQEAGRKKAVHDIEQALYKAAQGMELEDVKTEYISRINPATGKYEPVINKQVRTTKRIAPNIDAAKFYLSNRDPDNWKNKIEQENTGQLTTALNIRYVGKEGDEVFPSSESEISD